MPARAGAGGVPRPVKGGLPGEAAVRWRRKSRIDDFWRNVEVPERSPRGHAVHGRHARQKVSSGQ